MKSNAPWSVKGIERDARETAKEAARREGMTVGEWLNQMIYSQGQESSASSGEVEGLKLRDIVTAIEHLRNRIVETDKKNASAVTTLSRNVGGVVERVQRLERIKPAEGTYEDLAARLENVESASGDRNRIDALKALEKAVSQVAVQFSSAQKTTLLRLDSAEQQLQEFAERIDRVGLDGEQADISALKTTIEGLASRVARAEKVASEAAALREAAASSVDPEFVEQTGSRLRVLGDEIKRGGDQIRAFEGAIAKLSNQIEAAEKRSSDGVQKVAETITEVREQFLSDSDAQDDKPDVEALLASARQETDERLTALQRSFEEMNERVKQLNESAQSQPAKVDAAPPLELVENDASEEVAPGASSEATPESAQSDADEIEDAVAALEADAEEDPFGFADDDLEAETEDQDSAEAVEDFSFQLDEEGDDEAGGESAAATEENDAGQSRLSKVRSALTGEGFSDEPDANENSEADDDIESILADLDDAAPDLGDEDDEDEQAPGTASLTPASDVDAETGDDVDELGAAATDDDDAEAPDLAQSSDAAQSAPDDEQAADEEPKENYLASARRRAKEAAANREEEAKRPTRRNLTAKQRAILAARARQKQLTAKASEEPADEPSTDGVSDAPSSEPETLDTAITEESPARGRFSKIAAALSSARSRLGRGKSETEAEEADAAPLNIGAAEDVETSQQRNGDRAALETLKATSSARPLTLALAGGVVLAIALLVFLMMDIVGGGNEAITTPAPQPVETTTPEEPTSGDQTTPDAGEDLPVVPEAPAVDPEALYLEAMSALGAAEDETTALGAVSQLQDAAALGFPPAQLQLGELYKTGQGVDQDLGQARVWFRRAANGGNVLAMHRIGVMTARGDGGAADTQAAIGWFEQAANFGLVDSQYNLGAIYHPSENGSIVQNAVQAYYWYSLAAQNGDSAAEPLAAGVAAGLTTAERTAVDERVASWVAEEADPAANALAQTN